MPKILGKTLIGDSNISFVDAALISVPNTQIANRAQIRNLAADMGARMGVDRIMTQQIGEVPNEFGPNGERVFRALNDDRDLIRFVGSWINDLSASQARGAFAWNTSGLSSDYVEIVFYGTGLNMLTTMDNVARDFRYTLDGGVESADFNISANQSGVLNSRNYATNQLLNVVSGLSVGVHHVKIRNAGAPSNDMKIYGFEILNEATTIRVNAGALIKDQRRLSLDIAQTLLAKPASLTGSRGGRVLLYSSGGQVLQAVQPVDLSAVYLNSADHSNEDVARIHHITEFGAGRTDDFSFVSTSAVNRAFVLDDGTTTLLATNCNPTSTAASGYVAILQNVNDYFTLTFVGTGLDVMLEDFDASARYEYFVDGVSVGTTGAPSALNVRLRQKIVSGLPYGTHTVRIRNAHLSGGGADSGYFSAFIVYGPKKPTLPAGAVELADYCVMADFIANAVAGQDNIATGVLRAQSGRGAVYGGTWTHNGVSIGEGSQGQSIQTTTTNDYVEFLFFGSGFEYRQSGGASQTFQITLNGSTNLSGFTTSSYGLGSGSFTPSTGTVVVTSGTDNLGVRVSGLAVGLHKVRMTRTAGSSGMRPYSLDIITPIHSHKPNLAADLQNTLLVGNCSLSDSRQLIRADSGQNKFKGIAQGVTSGPSTSSTSAVPMPDMSLTVPSRGGWFDVEVNATVFNSGGNSTILFIYVNGFQEGKSQAAASTANTFVSNKVKIYLPPGVHKIDAYWSAAANTSSASTTARILHVEEL